MAIPSPTTVHINGPALRVIRTRTGTTPAAFAQAIGVDRSYLSKIETGADLDISPELFNKICRVLMITDTRALLAVPCETCAPTNEVVAS